MTIGLHKDTLENITKPRPICICHLAQKDPFQFISSPTFTISQGEEYQIRKDFSGLKQGL